tara:strand:- start:6146 stop:7606 length:1461 start_codon:yes stop_codon:yes gene_type:complete
MLKQSLQQKLLQKLSPQQIQLMKMLQLPTVALEARIKDELESNPALDEGHETEGKDNSEDDYDEPVEQTEAEKEFDFSEYMSDDDIPDYKYSIRNKGADDEDRSIPITVGKSFRDRLEDQVAELYLSETQFTLAIHLIGSLDESGYLRRELESVVDDLAFSQNIKTSAEDLEVVLLMIQTFDPPGVGARGLKECLLIQLRRKLELNKTVELMTAEKILEKNFDAFTKKHYKKIIEKLELEEEHLKLAIDEILKLNPKPGNTSSAGEKPIEHIVPDFLFNVTDGQFELTLNSRNAPDLKVSRDYKDMIKGYSEQKGQVSKSQKDAMVFIKQKLDSAKWFIDAIKQRQNTLLITISAILEYQREFFLDGDETNLKPMILKDIAEKIDMDISTVSRVANSKYIQTPYGTYLLKYFFSESLSTTDGEEVSTREVKKILQGLISSEEKRKPLTDEKLTTCLKEKGYNIARRTVAKYREQLNVPVARLRKEI